MQRVADVGNDYLNIQRFDTIRELLAMIFFLHDLDYP